MTFLKKNQNFEPSREVEQFLYVFVIPDCNSLLLQFPDTLTPEVQQYLQSVSPKCISMKFVLPKVWLVSLLVSGHSLFLILVRQVLPQSLCYLRVSLGCPFGLHGPCSSAHSQWKVVCLSLACTFDAWLKPSVLRDSP